MVKLETSCTASKNYLYLPAFYHNESQYEISDPFDNLTISDNFTIEFWKPLIEKVPSFSSSELPKHLKSLQEIPMNNLIRELDTVTSEQKKFSFGGYIVDKSSTVQIQTQTCLQLSIG